MTEMRVVTETEIETEIEIEMKIEIGIAEEDVQMTEPDEVVAVKMKVKVM